MDPRHLPDIGLPRRIEHQQGAMLLEALIALLIFAFGILAIVGLQAAAVKNVSESQYRVEAAMWADTLIGQMRTYDPIARTTDFVTGGGDATKGYTAWKNLVTAATTGLPHGAATPAPDVTFAADTIANTQFVTVTISWRAQTDTGDRHYTTTTLLD